MADRITVSGAPAVPEQYQPTERQWAAWSDYVDAGTGASEQGWWLGWCPLHDIENRDPSRCTAEFNFARGLFRCLAERPCHVGKRMMSLSNLSDLI